MSDLSAVWVNGQRQPDDGAHVSARDRGFTLADGLFETMRAHGARLFRLERHLTRLTDGLGRLAIPAPGRLADWITTAVRAEAAGSPAAVRVTVTRGAARPGVAPPRHPSPTVVVTIHPFPAFPAAVYQNGLSAHIASGRRNERAATNGLKTIAYTDAIAALIEAQAAGADEALFLDTEGHCSEATASNLFVVDRGAIVTPPLSCGALPGITREAVIELAAGIGISVVERPVSLQELLAAEEAFLTSSLRGIAPLVRVQGRPIDQARPGPMTVGLGAAYAALVSRECGTA